MGKIDLIVVGILAAAEGLLLIVEHADHGIKAAFDAHFLAYRRLVAEEFFPGVVAKHADMGGALVFLVGKEAAFDERPGPLRRPAAAVEPSRMVPATFFPWYFTATSPTRKMVFAC